MSAAEKSVIFSMATDEQEKISKDIENEILKAERLRAYIFAGVLGTIAIIFPTASFMYLNNVKNSENLPVSRMFVESILVGFTLFELYIGYTINRCLQKRKSFPEKLYYLVALVEISLPTILILTISQVRFINALFTPPVFLYFLIIALSGLKLNLSICIFIGSVAATEYILLSWHLVYSTESEKDLHGISKQYWLMTHIVKGLILLSTGVITGIVTNKLKKGFFKSFQSISEKNHIMGMFGQHVSPSVMEKLLHQKNTTEGEVQHVCVMFLDIRNFTTFSESRSPQEVVGFLNSLFEFMIEIVNKNHGVINKFLGDGFMAVFGAPLVDRFDCKNAVNASREILQRLEKEITDGNIVPTQVGIGLHTGDVVTGNVGSSQRKEYTIIGDVVNLASRIESLNKQFNSQLLISEIVKTALGDAGNDAISLGKVVVKGRAEPVEIFKLA
jgi:adenylate cyclase